MGRPAATGGIILIMALAGMLVMALQPVSLLRVESGEVELVICARVDAETPVTLTFTHSMFGGDVTETYVVDRDGALVRQRIVTGNAAAAEYYATDGRVRPVTEGYEVLAGPFSTDTLVIRVDETGDHRLVVGSSAWRLFDMFGEPAQVRISGDRAPRIRVPDTCMSPAEGMQAKGLDE
jgi:hypothetical protein